MKRIIQAAAVCAAFLAGAAFADAPLFRAAPPALSASTAARIAKAHPARSVAAVDPDPSAINTTVINVPLGGKTYRFVGGKHALPPVDTWQPGASKPASSKSSDKEAWFGKTADGDTAWIVKGKHGVTGDFMVGGRPFLLHGIEGGSVLIEVEPLQGMRSYDEVTPEMIAAGRKRAADERGKVGPKP